MRISNKYNKNQNIDVKLIKEKNSDIERLVKPMPPPCNVIRNKFSNFEHGNDK